MCSKFFLLQLSGANIYNVAEYFNKKSGFIGEFIVSGCESAEPKITEEQAKSIVVEQRSGSIGIVEIVSVAHKNNKYII